MTPEEKNEKLKSLRFKLSQWENAKRVYENHSDKMIGKDAAFKEEKIKEAEEKIKYFNDEI